MTKNQKAKKPSIDSIVVMYAAWLLLHMEHNGLLEKSNVEDRSLLITEAEGRTVNKAIADLEKKILNIIKLAAKSRGLAKEIEQRSLDIVDAFFNTGLQREGVVPPLLFACILFSWFVESGKPTTPLFANFSKPETYDGIFLSIEGATEVNWGTHIDAATKALNIEYIQKYDWSDYEIVRI